MQNPTEIWWLEIKENIIHQMRSYDPPDDAPGIDLETQETLIKVINNWFEDKIYDNKKQDKI